MANNDKNNSIVSKSNALIDTFYSLSVREHQLLAYAISRIPRTDIRLNDLSVTINLNEFKKFYALERLTYKKLNKLVEELGQRTFKYLDGNKLKTRNWSYGYDEELDQDGNRIIEQAIEVKFHRDVLPFLTGLSKTNPYTMYILDITKDFTSKHTFPFYEMLARTRHMREEVFSISIDQFKKKLCIEDKYKAFKDLKKYVITPIFSDLEECTLLEIDWELVKKGRTYTHIQVIFKEAPSAVPPGPKPKKKKLTQKQLRNSQAEKPAPRRKPTTKTDKEIKAGTDMLGTIKEKLRKEGGDAHLQQDLI